MSGYLLNNRLAGLTQRMTCLVLSRAYSKPAPVAAKPKAKGKGKGATILEKIKLPAESDTNKLVNYVCGSNIYLEGQDIEIKPKSEYPDWLFKMRFGKAPALEELDPNTKQYWRRLRKEALQRNNKLAKLKRF